MNNEQTESEQGQPDPGAPGSAAEEAPASGDQPSQEELRARLDQIRKLKVEDLLVESAVSVLNLTARRIAKEDERDLEQARTGIEAVRAWLDLMPEEAAGQIRNALSELQMLYAQAVEGKPLGEKPEDAPKETAPKAEQGKPPPRLWTPGSG